MKYYRKMVTNLTEQYFLKFDINKKVYQLFEYVYFLGNDSNTEDYNKSIIFLGDVDYLRPLSATDYSFVIKNIFDNNEPQRLILTNTNFSYLNNIDELHEAVKFFTEKDLNLE